MNRRLICLVILVISLVCNINAAPFTVVIDPGHGGKDPGARGSYVKEKDIVLDVALRFGRMIKDKYPDVNVIYTRSTDVFIPLTRRASIANKNKANLFISIHSDWSDNSSVKGASTFTLGQNRSRENFEIAKRENSVILLEDNYKQRYEGFDPNSAESYIMFEFMQDNYMDQSIKFASTLQGKFRNSGRIDRGVRQDVFLVLRNTSMPSSLVELGFLTNKDEENFLASDEGREKTARTLLSAFSDFKEQYSRKSVINGDTIKRSHKERSDSGRNGFQLKKEPIEKKESRDSAIHKERESNGNKRSEEEIVFKVQVVMSSFRLKENDRKFKGYSMEYYMEKGSYKYTIGNFKSFAEANHKRKELAPDFRDAFVVAFKEGKRISLDLARKETERK